MTDNFNGTIAVHPRGFGFLDLDDGRGSGFIVPPDLNRFLAGDRVSARITNTTDGRMNATHLTLLERTRRELFGSLTKRSGKDWLRIDRTISNTDWPLDGAEGVPEGALVIAEIVNERARLQRVVAPADASLELVRVRHDLRTSYPDEGPIAEDTLSRTDLRSLPTVTIDAPSSRDLDDAVAILPADNDGGLRLFVSIADVDSRVPEGSPLDLEARARGTSVYLAGQVLNMLPPGLAEDALSLLPGVDRAALTAEMRLDVDGQVTSIDLYPSLIRSHARLTYTDVTAFLDRGDPGAMPAAILPTLRWLRTAGARLGAVRSARGGVELLREEAYFTLDAGGEPTSVDARIDGSANVLIERLMVATNEAVARWLVERGLPALFRVHEEPEAETVHELVASAKVFGFELGLASRLTPRGLAALQAQFAPTSVAPAMRTVLARVLGPARYTVHPAAHFGLAAPLYLHFTSPIRRYADLAVHRIVKRFLWGERAFDARDPALEALAQQVNAAAWRATKAENERQHMLAARHFAGRVGERFAGYVVAVKPFGLVVQLAGVGVSGTIQTDTLPDGPYHVDKMGLVSAKRRFTVGDALRVEVASASEELARIELTLLP